MTVSLDVPSEGYIDENELNKYTKNREGQKKHLKYLEMSSRERNNSNRGLVKQNVLVSPQNSQGKMRHFSSRKSYN